MAHLYSKNFIFEWCYISNHKNKEHFKNLVLELEGSGNYGLITFQITDLNWKLLSLICHLTTMSSSIRGHPAEVVVMDTQMLEEKVSEARSKFERACQQIVLLDQKIKDLEVRYRYV